MKIDDVDWHAESACEVEEFDGRHIGVFLSWAARRGLLSALLLEDAKDEVERLVDGRLPERDFVVDLCDGVLVSDHLTRAGAEFARVAYEDYLNGYGQIVAQRESSGFVAIRDAAFALLDDAYDEWIHA